MTTQTAIGWTDFSTNPIKYRDRETGRTVWACVKKSAGCQNCYSEALALRWNKGQAFSRPNIATVEPYLDEKEERRLLRDQALSGKRVFVGDMTDIFGSWVPEAMLARLFSLFAGRPDVTWQVLTKRPERAQQVLSSVRFPYAVRQHGHLDWPLPNVWLGTSVEHQEAADQRIPHLLKTPAPIKFLSCEPLLGPVRLWDFNEWNGRLEGVGIVHDYRWQPGTPDDPGETVGESYPGIDWVIVGGESGPKHRQMDISAFNDLVRDCLNADVPVYVKQDSGMYPGRQGRIPESRWLHQWPETPPATDASRGDGGGV